MLKRLLAGLVAGAASCAAVADPIVRITAWVWADGSAAPVQSCKMDTDEWDFDDDGRGHYADWPREGLWGWDDGPFPEPVLLPHDVAITHTDDAGTRRTPVAYGVTIGGDPYLPTSSLRDAASATEAYLETEVSTWETLYDATAVNDLMGQWVVHWCSHPEDGWCEYIAKPDGTELGFGLLNEAIFKILPPMRGAERAELARCLERHASPMLRTERRERQIAGAGNWAKQVRWAADCPHEASARPTATQPIQGSSAPTSRQACALFHQYLTNSGIFAETDEIPASSFLGSGVNWLYLCDPSQRATSAIPNTNYTGNQIRYWAERREGAFPGFNCPVAASFSAPSSDGTRFDTTGLRGASRAGRANPDPVGVDAKGTFVKRRLDKLVVGEAR